MNVKELSREQLVELKQAYLNEVYCGLSWSDLAMADEIVSDELVLNYYDGICFCKDDFDCTAGR